MTCAHSAPCCLDLSCWRRKPWCFRARASPLAKRQQRSRIAAQRRANLLRGSSNRLPSFRSFHLRFPSYTVTHTVIHTRRDCKNDKMQHDDGLTFVLVRSYQMRERTILYRLTSIKDVSFLADFCCCPCSPFPSTFPLSLSFDAGSTCVPSSLICIASSSSLSMN